TLRDVSYGIRSNNSDDSQICDNDITNSQLSLETMLRGEENASQYKNDTVLLKLKDPAFHYADQPTGEAPHSSFLDIQMNEIEEMITATKVREFPSIGVVEMRLHGNISVEEAIHLLSMDPYILYAEPDYIISTERTPDDPSFDYLWGLQNINAPRAWDTSIGDENVVIAVVDTGVDYTHSDLTANMWANPNEIPGNGIDDDGNGYVDDIYGWDFCNNDNDPKDDHFHGTHCSGITGAVGNNNQGVVGVNWDVSIMALKFLSGGGSGYGSDAIECMEYAIVMKNAGVNIKATSNSWGGGGYSQAMYDAIAALRDADILFVAAAGNSARNTDDSPHYPSTYNLTNIISVAATDPDDDLAYFSNYGSSTVHVAAPGVDIYSTVLGDGYESYSGTSMATPYVSGLAALIAATNPSYNSNNIKNVILSSVDPIPCLSDKILTGGRINASMSLTTVPSNMHFYIHRPFEGSEVSLGEQLDIMISICDGVDPILNADVNVTLDSDGPVISLHDDGTGPDQVAGDGYYSGSWIPMSAGHRTLNITAAAQGYGMRSKEVNVLVSGGNYGIIVEASTGTSIMNNTISYTKYAIYLISSMENTLSNNDLSSNECGIGLHGSNHNLIANNTASDNSWPRIFVSGIFLSSSENNTISGNTILIHRGMGTYGFLLLYSNNNIVAYNTASSTIYGILLAKHSDHNAVTGNTLFDNWAGVYIVNSNGNTVDNNAISDKESDDRCDYVSYGIMILSSESAVLVNNTMLRNGIHITYEGNAHVIDTSNTVNGKPVIYWKNRTGGTVPLGAGQVILRNCTDVIVEGQNISRASVGISLGHTSNITIANNNLSKNVHGILLLRDNSKDTVVGNTLLDSWAGVYFVRGNDDNSIISNTISDNGYGVCVNGASWLFDKNNIIADNRMTTNNIGISIDSSLATTIFDNMISGGRTGISIGWSSENSIALNNTITNHSSYGLLVQMYSYDNVFVNNNISNNNNGVAIFSSASNNILHNNIISDNGRGIKTKPSTKNNLIYHNDLIDNQVYEEGTNIWNLSYPDGGNYWANHASPDEYSGPNQDQPGSDGFVDNPYVILGGTTQDNYPSTTPNLQFNWPPVADAGPDRTAHTLECITFDGSESYDLGGSVVSYSWDFGDGCSGSGSVVSHAYQGDGAYVVTLTVENNDGASDDDTCLVTVLNQLPVAVVNATERVLRLEKVTFNGSESYDPDGEIVSWHWDFGDMMSTDGEVVTHRYQRPGTYTVTLTVSDDNGASDTDTRQIAVDSVAA
ncbi:MAG: right-handed parallel beta-helix repeat-containing protein, partial [Thermoplasmata archaeon]|nr:right-handed parallel beta-helix repeat-containing protein [Thermoplasmata archaeon]